ncbi:hypothetical protein EJ05DRAFT_131526 [Pseudovirgaria hyperparasitica]|uniref:Uncharacterized protein n=1 Tax=Pseudovirgaria hyperparasitica TaxID=470096 RepID=A0A6A6VY16_9PEZI|nr:uncharacterized protein EJ05DRAFT_131526 [Pseudovirgaria hyperparasitica]KAF2754729.1 hypothetical protein EJ05DRAFT_131526 [Pseudovirgaria hyperparasitica]
MVDSSTPPPISQSVTFSTRAIENVSDIMDALNISTAMSIGYGTIHGNGSAAFVNENKVLDSELNYIVSVAVNNDNTSVDQEDMEFQPIEDLPPDRFTEVYGDSFISGFEEGGVFNAIISIQVNDKRKLREVKQAVDVQLAVGPVPVDVGVKEELNKSHIEALQDTEITISVNWTGGGEVKKPEVPWTLASVVAVANAFPSMVARSCSKTQAILMRYTALKSFQQWKWKMVAKDPDWAKKFIILNYAPCQLYTSDLFDAMMSYKKLWKRISEILKNPSKFKIREPEKKPQYTSNTLATDDFYAPRLERGIHIETSMSNLSQSSEKLSPCQKRAKGFIERNNTFEIEDNTIGESWDLYAINHDRSPIPVDPLALNEAKLLCREAMTLIVQEAARLVDHPHLAYAEFNVMTGKTQMKRPDFAYPEVLRMRLPVPNANDASDDSMTQDAAAIKTQAFSRDNDLYTHLVGDPPLARRTYKAFTSLDLNETPRGRVQAQKGENTLRKICLHSYHHHSLAWSSFDADADGAIGAIGFGFAHDPPSDKNSKDCFLHHYGHPSGDAESKCKVLDLGSKTASTEITRIDICFVPGTGRIAGIVFYDDFVDATTERLAIRQWGAAGREPDGLQVVTQTPPDDGEKWRFVGVCGEFDSSMFGEVLARVSGIWRRV